MRLRGIALLWAGLAVAAATGLFLLKYEVIALEQQLARLTHDIDTDRRAIHVLRAEWSYLNQPEMLDRLAGAYLDLVPVNPDRMATLEALPFRPNAAGTLGLSPAERAAMPVAPVHPPRVLFAGSAHAVPVPGQKPTVLAEFETRRVQP